MSHDHPMDAAEEAVFFAQLARIEYLREERRRQNASTPEVDPALRGTPWDPSLPAFLRRQAD